MCSKMMAIKSYFKDELHNGTVEHESPKHPKS